MNVETLSALAEKTIQLSSGKLSDFRLGHLHSFQKLGLHAEDPELYRFTKLEKFFENLDLTSQAAKSFDPSKFQDPSFFTLFFVDGVFQKIDIPGLKIFSLAEKSQELKSRLNVTGGVSHLHHALMNEGVVIELQKGVQLEKPLRIVQTNTRSQICAPTLWIKALSQSKMTLVEDCVEDNTVYACVSETYLDVACDAEIEHIQINQHGPKTLHHRSTYATLEKDGTYRHFIFHLSGGMNRMNLGVKLLGSGAQGESYGLYLTGLQEHSDINTVIHHQSPDSFSKQIVKGILDGESKGIFTGKIHIEPKSQRVASSQLNKNLLLSRKAQIFSRPQLEIFADDVKCSHGSTTGQLSPDEIFYFEARGIPPEKAKTLLAHGFGLEIVLKIKDLLVREKITDLILSILKTKFQIGGSL